MFACIVGQTLDSQPNPNMTQAKRVQCIFDTFPHSQNGLRLLKMVLKWGRRKRGEEKQFKNCLNVVCGCYLVTFCVTHLLVITFTSSIMNCIRNSMMNHQQ